MERINRIDQPQESAESSTGKARKVGLKPWESNSYEFQELQKLGEELDAQHCNARLELAQRIDSPHKDSDVIPSGEDYGYGPPVFGAKPDLNARASSTSGQGTLAGAYYAGLKRWKGSYHSEQQRMPSAHPIKKHDGRRSQSDAQISYGTRYWPAG